MPKYKLLTLKIIPLLLLSSLSHADPLPPKMTDAGVLFSYENPEVNSVFLGAEFNGWDMQKNPLTKDPATGIWSATVQLAEGHYEYKFIIDGEWMSGANLSVDVKKSTQGKLYIPAPKAGPNTPYSGKIRFGGNIIGVMNQRYFYNENRFRLDQPRFHIDLDWDVAITKEIDGFIRAEMDSLVIQNQTQLPLNLFKSHLNISPQWFTMKVFNNEKNVQMDDPLRLTDKDVSLRYDTLEFVDEPNPLRGLGLKTQGLTLDASPLGWFDLTGFYLNRSNSDMTANFFDGNSDNFSEDNWGLRAKRSFGEIIGLGASYFARTGIKWPYADSNNWFPDPTNPFGHTFNPGTRNANLADGLPVENFNGFINRSDSAFDLKFQAFPGLWLYGEYLLRSETLKSNHRNGRTFSFLPSTLDWKLFDQTQVYTNVEWRFHENYAVEGFWSRRTINLGGMLNTSQTNQFSANGNRMGARARYDQKEFAVGAAIIQDKTDPFSSPNPADSLYVDAGVLPTLNQFRFSNFSALTSSSPVGVQEGDVNFQPYMRFDFGERFKAKVFGNFHHYIFRSSSASLTSYSLNPTLVPTFLVRNYEALADFSAQITGPFYFQGSGRFAKVTDIDFFNASGQFWSAYAAVVYKPKKNMFFRLGWGVDPEGFDEDLKEDFDQREQFLYNRYVEAIGRGENVSQALVSAERALEAEERISLRVEIHF